MGGHLNHRYQLGEVVGSGGMGSVHRATDMRLERTVAIKMLRDGPDVDHVARARMRSEAQLAASIHHPGVAQVYDFDEDPSFGDGTTFIVMQFIDGHSLSAVLRERGPLPPDQVMSVVQQVAEGLAATHALGIVHRDLKPANIMLTPEGRTVLVDFGIAQTSTSEPLTDTGALVGTTDYLSPEQARGQSATPQSDLYALGVVAYHCLTGNSPFRRETHIATAMAQLHDELPPLGPAVPPRLAALLYSMTAKDPEDRPASAADVAREAAAVGAAHAIDMPPTFNLVASASAAPRTQQTATVAPAPPVADDDEPSRSRMPVFAGLGLIVVVLLSLLGGRALMAGEALVVPDVVGADVEDARAEIRDADLVTRVRMVDVARGSAGEVVKQTPAAGTEVDENEAITLLVTSGKVRVAAKDILGRSYTKAAAALEKRGFGVRRKDVTTTDADAGDVVAIDKTGRLPRGAVITLSVAVKPAASTSSGGSGSSSKATKPEATKPKAPKRKAPNKNSGPGSNSGKKGKGQGK